MTDKITEKDLLEFFSTPSKELDKFIDLLMAEMDRRKELNK